MALSTVWQTLLAPADVPQVVLREAFEAAVAARSTIDGREVMVALMRHPKVPDDLRERLATTALGKLPVVLAPALRHPYVPARLVQHVWSLPVEQKKTLATTLAWHPEALTPAQAAHVVAWVGVPRASVRLLARLGQEQAVRLLSGNRVDPVLLEALATFDVPLRVLLEAEAKTRASTKDRKKTVARIWAHRPELSAAALRAALADVGLGQAGMPPAPVAFEPLHPWSQGPARFDVPADGAIDPVEYFTMAATSTDPTLVAEAVQEFVSAPRWRAGSDISGNKAQLLRLLRNDLVTASTALTLVEAVACSPFVTEAIWQDADVIGEVGMGPAASVWARLCPTSTLVNYGWEPFGGPAAGPALVASLKAATLDEVLLQRPAMRFLTALVKAGADGPTLAALPVGELVTLTRSAREYSRTVGRTLTALLCSRLSTPAHWATYRDLEDEFPGTLGELLDVCTAVAAA